MIFYLYACFAYLSQVTAGTNDGDYKSVCRYDNGTSTFDCTNSRLYSIPHLSLPPLTKRLLLSHNVIEDANFMRSFHFENASVTESVEILDLSHNHIHCLNFQKISIFTALRELYIHHNQVQSIVIPSASAINLRQLSLGNNRLQEAVFSGHVFRSLQVLDLNNNLLSRLPDNAFPMSLKKLNLSENKLTVLNVRAFDKNIMLYVDLQENPWNCSRQLIIDYIFLVFDSPHVKTTCTNGDSLCIPCNRHLQRKQLGDVVYQALTNESSEVKEQELVIKEVYLRAVILLETSLLICIATLCSIKCLRRRFSKQMVHVELDNHMPSPLSSRRSLTTMVNQPVVPPRFRANSRHDANIYSEVIDPPLLIQMSPSRPYIAPNQLRQGESARIRRLNDERQHVKVRRASSAPVMESSQQVSSSAQYLLPIASYEQGKLLSQSEYIAFPQ